MHYRISVVLALFCFAFMLPVAKAQQDQAGLRIEQDKVIFGLPVNPQLSIYKPGEWTPVFVPVKHPGIGQAVPVGKASRTQIIVETEDNDDLPNRYVVEGPTVSPGAQEETVITYVRPGKTYANFTVTLRDGEGRWLQTVKKDEGDSRVRPAGSVVYLQAGSRLNNLAAAINARDKQNNEDDNLPSRGEDNQNPFIEEVDYLPTRWYGYAGVDVMFLTTGKKDFVEGLLNDRQNRKEALAEWVRRGGRLVISVGHNHLQVSSLLEKMPVLSCSITGGGTADRLEALEEWVGEVPALKKVETAVIAPVSPERCIDVLVERALPKDYFAAQLAVPNGDPLNKLLWCADYFWEKPGEQGQSRGFQCTREPLVLEAPYGLGRVLLIACDIENPSFATWKGNGQFLQQTSG